MRLGNLLGPEIDAPPAAGGVEITGLTADSRAVKPGMVFAALSGSKSDGSRFIADAVARGAVAILTDSATVLPATVLPATGAAAVLRAADPRRGLALMASRLYPRQPGAVLAVTGTAGKTSVAEFTRQTLSALGRSAASLGTIGVVKPAGAIYGSLTTPDPVTLHQTIDGLAGEGVTHLAMEASSHGLDQRRLDGVKLAAAAFTNLGRDHLDYHPTVEEYLAAKLRLFDTLLEPGRTAVVCADGGRAADVVAAARGRGHRILTTGRAGHDLKLLAATRDGFRQKVAVEADGRRYDLTLGLIGDYQASNALVAAGLAIAAGEKPADVVPALEKIEGVKGRLEIVGEARGGLAVVDYAHKPEALAAALAALRPFVTGKLICVFGCGGDRDAGKRPIMGKIAVDGADVVIVTDDNPRTEVPAAIRKEIMAAAHGAREIGDRAEAIHAAVTMMGDGDVVLVAGKGHEEGQIVGPVTLPFSDHDVVHRAIEEISQ